jgi:hypothetical protein
MTIINSIISVEPVIGRANTYRMKTSATVSIIITPIVTDDK